MILIHQALGRISAWAEASQQQARRNALVASTVLARVRAERLAAEEAIARAVRRSLPPVPQEIEPVVPAQRRPADEDVPVEA